jgi:uncharacterized membrane protein
LKLEGIIHKGPVSRKEKGIGMALSSPAGKGLKPASLPVQTGPDRALLSLVLRGGVFLSAALIVLGLSLFLITGQTGYAAGNLYSSSAGDQQYTTFRDITVPGQEIYFPSGLPEIWQGSLVFKPFALIMLGLLVLVATPVLNLALAGWGFLHQKNWAFSLICLTVLSILAVSFLIGTAGG